MLICRKHKEYEPNGKEAEDCVELSTRRDLKKISQSFSLSFTEVSCAKKGTKTYICEKDWPQGKCLNIDSAI